MDDQGDLVAVFPTAFGWMAVSGSGPVLKHLTFGHRTATAARRAIQRRVGRRLALARWNPDLASRLADYAAGAVEDFLDVPVDLGGMSEFARSVYHHCRRIPYGETTTYGRLAAMLGRPEAARAVGNSMARNPVPLVIPCHRVVGAGGSIGGYSAPGGVRWKRRLLELEARHRGAGRHGGRPGG
ncbi:MAG TPA: methylated-DNA--[protein]-cysteine S-methyltransferase [Planctomycetes bacterium]|nr:methylated-DNA--[protein]-cysteine S-methyltransferase [Planctomycetota bacterium]